MNFVPQNFTDPSEDLLSIAEQNLLGIFLINSSRVDDVSGTIKPEMFFWPLHKRMAELIFEGKRIEKPYTLLTITSEIGTDYFPNEVDKRYYMAGCVTNAIDTRLGQAKYLAEYIHDAWNKRRINAVMQGPGTEFDKAQALADLNREIARAENQNIITLSNALDHAMQRTDATYKRGGGLAGLATGLTDLDNMLCGLEAGGLYVLAGRPGMGKTAAALTMGMNVAQQGKRVMFFSLEMSAEQLAHRINARYANVSIWAQKVKPQMHDFIALQEARSALSQVKFDIVDCSGVTAQHIVAKAFGGLQRQRPDLIIIDHLGIVAARDARTPRVYQVGEMTAAFKGLAKDAQCPVLLLHQLNRGVEQRDDKRPSMADLRDSGSVEQDADVVMLLYRPEYYLSGEIEKREGESDDHFQTRKNGRDAKKRACAGLAEIIVPKNRQGMDGTIKLRFDARRQVFENLEATP